MTDTPDEIKKLQLAIWLTKSPGERLNQFMIENEALYQFWDHAKAAINTAKQVGNTDTGKKSTTT